jgi:hypothetical protein
MRIAPIGGREYHWMDSKSVLNNFIVKRAISRNSINIMKEMEIDKDILMENIFDNLLYDHLE